MIMELSANLEEEKEGFVDLIIRGAGDERKAVTDVASETFGTNSDNEAKGFFGSLALVIIKEDIRLSLL